MGGLVVPVALVTAFPLALVVEGHVPNPVGLAAAATVVAMAGVGLIDDGMKVFRERNLGLRELQKTVLQTLVSFGFAVTVVSSHGTCQQLALTNCTRPQIHVPGAVYIVAIMAILWGATNAVQMDPFPRRASASVPYGSHPSPL